LLHCGEYVLLSFTLVLSNPRLAAILCFCRVLRFSNVYFLCNVKLTVRTDPDAATNAMRHLNNYRFSPNDRGLLIDYDKVRSSMRVRNIKQEEKENDDPSSI